MIIEKFIFYTSGFIIFWAMIGYPVSLKLINKFYKPERPKKIYSYQPTVTVMVVAHNEEDVIYQKLENLTELDYPKEKISFIISSDNSTDKTNDIVNKFIMSNTKYKIELYEVKERKGKTNAQNEAQKIVKSEILVMTDANSMLEKKSIIELVAYFTDSNVSYVSGKLIITNDDISDIASSENTYWNKDLEMREIESNLQTITAGNGAIYACRNDEYVDFDSLKSHDSMMPRYYALKGKRALYNPDAIAYEKAGEIIEDEFKRKVRMNREILVNILPNIRILNIKKYKWYSYFYLGHRTSRYLLWIAHALILISNLFLFNQSWIYKISLIGQTLFYLLAFMKEIFKVDNEYINIVYYYTVTIIAQWIGVYNILTNKIKPYWEKAESTR